MPASYGIRPPTEGAGLLDWSFVTSRMEVSRNYWVASASSDGRPHAAPVWGLWHDDSFYFSTDRQSRKGRNVAARPSVVVHLESGDEAVMIEGKAEPVDDSALLAELDGLYVQKYAFHLDAGATYKVAPSVAFAWLERDFVGTATKWEFGT
jgi:nitroimidazol reductase NimA-like FMN-containing flavoprotein (pyridoxamine 5'-phosphate oxidase superfamily)